jgi:hypothetical protein
VRITKFSCAIEILPILGESAAAVEPRQRPLNDPALGQHHESLGLIRALDDLRSQVRQDFLSALWNWCPLITGVSEQRLQERIHPEQGRKQQDAAVAILDVSGMNDGVEQQTQRIYQNVAFLALDLFARIIAMRIDAGPPFSALFTLWLSMMGSGRARFAFGLLAAGDIECMVMRSRVPSQRKYKIVMDRALWRNVLGQCAPLTTRAQDVHDPVHHLPDINRSFVAARFGGRDQRRNMRPFLVRQITRISQPAGS